jgi:hypothetical protein
MRTRTLAAQPETYFDLEWHNAASRMAHDNAGVRRAAPGALGLLPVRRRPGPAWPAPAGPGEDLRGCRVPGPAPAPGRRAASQRGGRGERPARRGTTAPSRLGGLVPEAARTSPHNRPRAPGSLPPETLARAGSVGMRICQVPLLLRIRVRRGAANQHSSSRHWDGHRH